MSLFCLIVLYSISNKCGLYSAISLRIEILFFSLPENLPPADLGRRVQIHLLRYFFTKFSAIGTLFRVIKSNLISTYSDLLRVVFKSEFNFDGLDSSNVRHVLYVMLFVIRL